MYNSYNASELRNVNIKDSKIESPDISGPMINGGTANGLYLNNAILINPSLSYSGSNLETMISSLQSQVHWHQTQLDDANKKIEFLLKLLVQKNVLDDEGELKELIESSKVVDKLVEVGQADVTKNAVL